MPPFDEEALKTAIAGDIVGAISIASLSAFGTTAKFAQGSVAQFIKDLHIVVLSARAGSRIRKCCGGISWSSRRSLEVS
ncbi:hypothetical protein [Bradyrhizobium paxllaeri]|uniref:hypothetical protein n=1 Tax=Bradyrhizobium paxllaeri TaxID=190148 RepID=UPI00081096D1|nr:hypothetical protein [Bradyrhizobium paxllaeri]